MFTYDELMGLDYYGSFMDDATSIPSYNDIINLVKEVKKNPMDYDFTIDDIRERCINVFGIEPIYVERCITLTDCFWNVRASGVFYPEDAEE